MSEFYGRVAVITGGSNGIGAAAAAALAERGAKVVITGRRLDRVERVASALCSAGHEALGVAMDVGDPDAMQRLADQTVETYGRADIVLLNAGLASPSSMLDINLANWKKAIDTHLYGLLNGIKSFLPILQGQEDGGSLLATSSGSGVHGTMYRGGPYAATKNAQLTIMECLYGELRDAGSPIHVGIVLPPLVRTGLAGDDPAVWQRIEADLIRSGRGSGIVEPEEFAEVLIDGIRMRDFWIVNTEEQNLRYCGGRNAGSTTRTAATVLAKATAIITHQKPDSYLW